MNETSVLMEGLRERTYKEAVSQPNHMNCILAKLFPNEEILDDCCLPMEKEKRPKIVGKNFRPDFILPQRKLVIEIDGDSCNKKGHYSNARVAIKDIQKTKACESVGYKVVRIPFYVQLDLEMVKFYFGIDYEQELYPACHCHGFEHPLAALPSDFCDLGIERFEKEMAVLPQDVRATIIESLQLRIANYKNEGYSQEEAILLVVPKRLQYLIAKD